MPRCLLETQAIVLHKENSNDNFIGFDLFCPSSGKLRCLSRLTKKNLTNSHPDLFDLVTLQLSPAKQGDLLFLKDFQINRRHPGIAKNYSAFYHACQWTKILLLNLSHVDRPQPLFLLTEKALHAFELSINPESTYLKTLYLFNRQEGYPIKEHWLINLPNDLLNTALIALQSPLKLQNIPSNAVEELIDHLHTWITQYTEILLPRQSKNTHYNRPYARQNISHDQASIISHS